MDTCTTASIMRGLVLCAILLAFAADAVALHSADVYRSINEHQLLVIEPHELSQLPSTLTLLFKERPQHTASLHGNYARVFVGTATLQDGQTGYSSAYIPTSPEPFVVNVNVGSVHVQLTGSLSTHRFNGGGEANGSDHGQEHTMVVEDFHAEATRNPQRVLFEHEGEGDGLSEHALGHSMMAGANSSTFPFSSDLQTKLESAIRQRRAVGTSTSGYCTIFVDFDKSFRRKWGKKTKKVKAKIATIMAQIEAWSATVFPDVQLHHVGTEYHDDIHPDIDLPIGSTASSFLTYVQRVMAQDAVGERVRKSKKVRPNEVCLNLFLSHIDLAGGSAGATVVSNSNAGGVCDQQIKAPPVSSVESDLRAWNVIVVTSNFDGKKLSLDTLTHTIAHEVGHAFGAQHTCCLGCSYEDTCEFLEGNRCNPEGDFKYLMYPYITSGPNSWTFSRCSNRAIKSALEERGTCFNTEEEVADM
eukprot:m.67989 g.67989  ORF g.67989 m.67989 type:complete len:472 (-) comp12183_c0_seq1:445-1860(-)